MKFTLLHFAVLASFTNAIKPRGIDPVQRTNRPNLGLPTKRDLSPLAVTIEVTNNTLVKANVINNGPKDLNIVHLGTLLDDDDHLQKAYVYQAGKELPFKGMHAVLSQNLSESAFKILPAGGSIQASFDIANTYDLSQGGVFDIVAKGTFAYAEPNTTAITGSFPFTSNTITATVDGTQASKTHTHHSFARRTILELRPWCPDDKFKKAAGALTVCSNLAMYAAMNVPNSEKFEHFWGIPPNSAPTVVRYIKNIYEGLAHECRPNNPLDSKSRVFCIDNLKLCRSGDYVMRPIGNMDQIYLCDRFFDETKVPALNAPCHQLDRGSYLIQGMSMLKDVGHMRPIRSDPAIQATYEDVMHLRLKEKVQAAASYAYFAQALGYDFVYKHQGKTC